VSIHVVFTDKSFADKVNANPALQNLLKENNMKIQHSFKQIMIILTFVFSTQTGAAVQVIANVGQPAPDFPPGYIYWSVGPNPVIGASGHIAFSGVADISLGSTENNTNAVWAGLLGQLRTIVRENEAVSGFPPNVLFDSAEAAQFVVTPSGSVGFPAIMKGAGQSTQRALLAHANGTTLGILRDGDPAPAVKCCAG